MSQKDNSVLPFSKRQETSENPVVRESLSAHCVQFVASPGMTEKLCAAIDEIVSPILNDLPGFRGLVVTVSKREPRLVSVHSFARSQSQAANLGWEEIPTIQNFLRKLVDRCCSEDAHEAYVQVAPQGVSRLPEDGEKIRAN